MRENLFAGWKFLHVPSLYLPVGSFLKSTTFVDFTCVLVLSVTLQFIVIYLVEIYFFGEPSPSAERHEARVVNWLHKMLQKLCLDSENLSSLVVAVLLISLSRGVLEGSWNSIYYKLLCAVIIVLFGRIPLVRTGWRHRPRVLSCLSAFFLACNILVFLRLVWLLILEMVEFPKSSCICFAIILLFLSLHVFNKIFGKSSQGSKKFYIRKRQSQRTMEMPEPTPYKLIKITRKRSKFREILQEDESQSGGAPDDREIIRSAGSKGSHIRKRHAQGTMKKPETTPITLGKDIKKFGLVKSGVANSALVLPSSTGESQLVIEGSKDQEILEDYASQNDGVPDEKPSKVIDATFIRDTFDRIVSKLLKETATSSCGSSGGTNIVDEGEEVEISPEADPGQAKIAPDVKGYMSDCILYCSLFPADYEFTRDTLVWSWIAAGIINPMERVQMEKIAMRCFDELIISKFILPSSYDRLSDQMRYKFVQVSFTNQKYRKKLDDDANFTDLEHLSLIFQEIDELQFKNLRNCSNLKTLLLHKCHGSKIENLLNHVFLELKLVTLIDLSCTNIVELPSSIENLWNLMYLDLSQTPIRRLPESIDSLEKLETLILLGCQSLSGLPRAISKLINLQHLELDIARQLQSVPTGMGNLKNLQTLRTFVVGRKDGNGIGELMDMDRLKGSLCIFKLENIPNKEEASKAFLHKKIYLTNIEFIWSDLEDDKVTIEKEILENLRPHFGLQELKIIFYSGGELPSWISDPSFNKMVNITLSGCRYCEQLPCLGALPSLKILSVVDMDSVVCIDFSFCREWGKRGFAFPQLEKLSFDGMSNLENWTGVEDGDFPCLVQLVIKYCPKLVSLPSPSHLKSPEVLKISNCPKLPCFPKGGV